MRAIGCLALLILLLCATCLALPPQCTLDPHPKCDFFVCNRGPLCPNITQPWIQSIGEAFSLISDESTPTTDISLFVAPGHYVEGLIRIGFDYQHIRITSFLETPNFIDTSDYNRRSGEGLPTLPIVFISGGFYSENITTNSSWTLEGLIINNKTDAPARCIHLKSAANLRLTLRRTTLFCTLQMNVSEPYEGQLELVGSELFGTKTKLDFGAQAMLSFRNSIVSAGAGSHNHWTFHNGSAKLVFESTLITSLIISSSYNPLSFAMYNSSLAGIMSLNSPKQMPSPGHFLIDSSSILGTTNLTFGDASTFSITNTTVSNTESHFKFGQSATATVATSLWLSNSTWALGHDASLSILNSMLHNTHLFNSTEGNFNVTFDTTFLYRTNVTAASQLHLSASRSWTERGFTIYTRRSQDVVLEGNAFHGFALFMANQLTAKITNNTFTGQRRVHPRNQLSAGNLVMLIDCIADVTILHNLFKNGSAFLAMRADSPFCNNHAVSSAVHYNHFNISPRHYSLGDVLKDPSVPALGFFPVSKMEYILDSTFGTTFLNATRNWWGSPTGPYFCCNKDGVGAYTSNKIDVGDWCLTKTCESFSGVSFPSNCIHSTCPQPFTFTQRVVFYTSFALGTVILLTGLITLLIRDKLQRNPHSLETLADMEDRAYSTLYIGLAFSTLGSIVTASNIVPLLYSSWTTGARAHQQRMAYRNMIIMSCFCIVSLLQPLLNIALAIAVRFSTTKFSRWFHHVLPFSYFWNIITLCSSVTLAIWWIPYSGYADLFDPYFLTLNTPLNFLVYLPSLLITMMSICTIIPIHWVFYRVKHYEYWKVRKTIDTKLLVKLRRERGLERFARVVRLWISVAMIVGVFAASLTTYGLVTDPFTTPRYLTSAFEIVLAMGTLGLAVQLTFAYDRLNLLMAATVMLILLIMGSIQDVVFWAVYIVVGEHSLARDVMHLVVTVIWSISLVLPTIYLWRLGTATLRRLPQALASNLNEHLDEAWGATSVSVEPYSTKQSRSKAAAIMKPRWDRSHDYSDRGTPMAASLQEMGANREGSLESRSATDDGSFYSSSVSSTNSLLL